MLKSTPNPPLQRCASLVRRIATYGALSMSLFVSSAYAETLRIAHNLGQGGRESLDPISPSRFYEANKLIYNGLVRADSDGKPVGDLAISWTSSPDFKTWTLKLRPNVKFHDGSVFDSADVVYSLRRILSPKIASPLRSVLSIMKDISAPDPSTVVIDLQQAHADFPLVIMDYRVKMVSSEGHQDDLDSLNETGIGTGPFKIEKLNAEGTTTLSANMDYWEGRPKVDAVEIIAIPDTEARVQALLAGQIDLTDISGSQAKMFEGRSDFELQTIPTGDWRPLVMRTDVAPFTDVRVRKAFKILADRQAIVDAVLGKGNGVVACDQPVWPGDPYYAGIVCPQDVEKAKSLLAEAGYPNGLEVDLYASDVNSSMIKLAQVYQGQASKAGIKVNIRVVPANGYWKSTWMNKSFVAGNWSQRPADQILNEAFRSGAKWNETFWKNAEFDSLLDKAREAGSFEERKAIYGRAQQLIFDEGGSFVPFFEYGTRAFSKKLSGVEPVHEFFFHWNLIAKSE